MTKLKILFAFVLLITLAVGIHAGDYAELNYIGVSKDGKHLAFEEYGTQDGSGYPYSNIYFIDVDKNVYAAKILYNRFIELAPNHPLRPEAEAALKQLP